MKYQYEHQIASPTSLTPWIVGNIPLVSQRFNVYSFGKEEIEETIKELKALGYNATLDATGNSLLVEKA